MRNISKHAFISVLALASVTSLSSSAIAAPLPVKTRPCYAGVTVLVTPANDGQPYCETATGGRMLFLDNDGPSTRRSLVMGVWTNTGFSVEYVGEDAVYLSYYDFDGGLETESGPMPNLSVNDALAMRSLYLSFLGR